MKHVIILILLALLSSCGKPDHQAQIDSIHKTKVNDIGFIMMSHEIDSAGWIMDRGEMNFSEEGDTSIHYFREDSLFIDDSWETKVYNYDENIMLKGIERLHFEIQYEWINNLLLGFRVQDSVRNGDTLLYEFANNNLVSLRGKGYGDQFYYYSKNNLLGRSSLILNERAKNKWRGDSLITTYKRNEKGLLIRSTLKYATSKLVTTFDSLQLPLRGYDINDNMDTTYIMHHIYYKNGKRYGGK